jgi:hypothetical protein
MCVCIHIILYIYIYIYIYIITNFFGIPCRVERPGHSTLKIGFLVIFIGGPHCLCPIVYGVQRVHEALLFIQEWTRGEKIMAPRSREVGGRGVSFLRKILNQTAHNLSYI